jgi:hypothetical protein
MLKYDLIILIFACDTIEKYKNQIETITLTWGKKAEEYNNILILYFLGEEKTNYFKDSNNIKYINLEGVSNDYLSASYKQFLGMKYIYENYKVKFIISIGTDTYINVPKLLLFINNYDHMDNLYIGGHGDKRRIGDKEYYFHSGGPGFILSYDCLSKIYDLLPNIMEDWINVCNQNEVPYLIVGCDVAISYYIQQPEINSKIIIIEDYSFINCNYQGSGCCNNLVNINNIISCHSLNENEFYDFTDILNKNNYFI